MSATEHGQSLTSALILQPGSTFAKTKGGYDTGSRRYKCDATVAATLAPAIGSVDATYPGMFVESVDINDGVAGISEITVSYKGTINTDPNAVDASKNEVVYRMDANVDFYDELAAYGVKVTKYIPLVIHTYVSSAFPAFGVGESVDPPKFSDKVPPFSFRLGAGTLNLGVLISRWKLHNRNVESVGESFEVTDTYMFEYYANAIVWDSDTGTQISALFTEAK